MADTKISAETLRGTILSTDEFAIAAGGADFKATMLKLAEHLKCWIPVETLSIVDLSEALFTHTPVAGNRYRITIKDFFLSSSNSFLTIEQKVGAGPWQGSGSWDYKVFAVRTTDNTITAAEAGTGWLTWHNVQTQTVGGYVVIDDLGENKKTRYRSEIWGGFENLAGLSIIYGERVVAETPTELRLTMSPSNAFMNGTFVLERQLV